jgi:hypothetical protein
MTDNTRYSRNSFSNGGDRQRSQSLPPNGGDRQRRTEIGEGHQLQRSQSMRAGEWHLRLVGGMTREEYQNMLRQQGQAGPRVQEASHPIQETRQQLTERLQDRYYSSEDESLSGRENRRYDSEDESPSPPERSQDARHLYARGHLLSLLQQERWMQGRDYNPRGGLWSPPRERPRHDLSDEEI